ncbi:NAD(P)H-dependent oxidoreductase subunit E [Acidihalobacter ferrooxydans]|uniref:NADH-quinone oxidoreductase subunit E n=1 Tax=Acidihalobacter ferrooxydans TaxID=1765967 RepID=A0A1P8UGY1_9GAMM|nr:NAD(P)H-dependent oxidoreductase subunit E [Acidihalobacter ferrooxydans]APZ43096.1 formate dehydrogenase [Acidihalobacter ferrooxydans]
MSDSRDLPISIAEICRRHDDDPAALLPLLHELQERAGHVSPQAVADIAECLNVTRAEVDGVVSFYSDFRTQPPAARVVKVCRAEACQASGGRAVWDAAVAAAARTAGAVEVEAVYCLGNCACGPSALSGEQLFGRVDGTRIDALIERFGQEAGA